MSNRDVATGLFRAWGVIWAVYVLIGLPQLANTLLRNPYGPDQDAMRQFAISSQAISLGCQIVIAVSLLRKASWLAELVFPVEGTTAFAMTAEDLQAVLFSSVGLYFLLDGIQLLAAAGFQVMRRPRDDYLWQREAERLAMGLAGVVAGGVVLLGRGRFLTLENFQEYLSEGFRPARVGR
jgi:hypothetical protein